MLGDGVHIGALVGAMVVIWLVGLVAFVSWRWRRAGPNEALVICGPQGKRVVVGGSVLVVPGLQTCNRLSLEIMTLDVTTPEVHTADAVPVFVEGVAQVKVDGSDEAVQAAAEHFLCRSTTEIASVARQTVEGHLRATVRTMATEEMRRNPDTFSQRVQEVAASDLASMGLRMLSLTIGDIRVASNTLVVSGAFE